MAWHGVTITDSLGIRDGWRATYATTTNVQVGDQLGGSDTVSTQQDYTITISDRLSARDSIETGERKVYPFRDKGGHSPLRPVVIPRRRYFTASR